jgi:hypothetical protein
LVPDPPGHAKPGYALENKSPAERSAGAGQGCALGPLRPRAPFIGTQAGPLPAGLTGGSRAGRQRRLPQASNLDLLDSAHLRSVTSKEHKKRQLFLLAPPSGSRKQEGLREIRQRYVGAKRTSGGRWIGGNFNGNACMMLVSHAPLCWELVLDRDRDGSHFGAIVRVPQMQLTAHPNMPAENR